MQHGEEVERIRNTYAYYDSTGSEQAKRDHLNPGNRRIVAEREELLRSLLSESGLLPLSGLRVLDVGCGVGGFLAHLARLGADEGDLYGIDLLPDRIEIARRSFPAISFSCGNAASLEFSDGHFDMVSFSTVFSSVLDEEMALRMGAEADRVLKPGGAVLWCDFRYDNPTNPHTRGMSRRRIRHLFPNAELDLRTVTLLPPLARRLGRLTAALYPLLAAFPFMRSHYLGLLRKPVAHAG